VLCGAFGTFISPHLGTELMHGLPLKSRLLIAFREIPGAIDTTGGHRLLLIGLGISDSSRRANIEAQSNNGCSNPGRKRREMTSGMIGTISDRYFP
jgi:hypothetical protein